MRGAGLLVGIELVEGSASTPAEGAAVRAASDALEQGLLVLPAGELGQVVELTPALLVTDEQIEFGAEVLVSAIRNAS